MLQLMYAYFIICWCMLAGGALISMIMWLICGPNTEGDDEE